MRTLVAKLTSQHRLFAAITAAIIVSIGLTLISMTLYYTSGAQVLDLSRPGYESVRKAVDNAPHTSDDFSSDGPVTGSTIDKFNQIYNGDRHDLKSIDDFSSHKPLSDKSLNLD